ncbi:hypothetical protein KJ991_00560 [Patescibacteria group bacterium]|nr:hypothetical protein [Patescibacteria group bacterium]MBU4057485.1 hypothetical protein [Patescibacteria group bacterium]MBU4116019.1 hypothetical protein [Patescibacteria group bacterium]
MAIKEKTKIRNPVCAILWMDATYTTEKELPKELPQAQLTVGFIISTNKKFTNIAMNVKYDPVTRRLWPVDGLIIPRKAKIKFIKLAYLNGKI